MTNTSDKSLQIMHKRINKLFSLLFPFPQKESEMIYVNVSKVRDDVSQDEARLYNPFIITVTSSPMHIIYPYYLIGVSRLHKLILSLVVLVASITSQYKMAQYMYKGENGEMIPYKYVIYIFHIYGSTADSE